MTKSRLVLILDLIGWERGTSLVDQSYSKIEQNESHPGFAQHLIGNLSIMQQRFKFNSVITLIKQRFRKLNGQLAFIQIPHLFVRSSPLSFSFCVKVSVELVKWGYCSVIRPWIELCKLMRNMAPFRLGDRMKKIVFHFVVNLRWRKYLSFQVVRW